jgi:hypothetical protein
MKILLRWRTLKFFGIGILLSTVACGPSVDTSDPTATPPAIEDVAEPTDHPADLPDLADGLLSLEEVASIMEMNLTEEEVYPDLSQAFEHADTTHLTEYVTAIYRGTMEEGGVMIDLAAYENPEAASEIFNQIAESEMESADDEATVVFESVEGADAAQGIVYPPSEGNEFTVTGIVLRSGPVIAFITVLSHDEDGRHVRARELAVDVVRKLNE